MQHVDFSNVVPSVISMKHDAMQHTYTIIMHVLPFLCSVCELTEVHQQIASNRDALDQMICLSHSPSTQILWSMLVSTVYICLANNVSVHKYLTQPGIIEGLMDVSQLHKVKTAEHLDSILLR